MDVDDGVGLQETEDSLAGPQAEDMPIDEAGTILLYVIGSLNGFSVKFLTDSGASECFVGTKFAEKHGLVLTKTKKK